MRTSTAPFLSFYMLRGRRRLRTVRASTAPFLFASLDLLNSVARRHLRASTAANFSATTATFSSLNVKLT